MTTEPRLITAWPRWQLTGSQTRWAPNKVRERGEVAGHVRAAVNACFRGETPTPLFFTGASGTGKTCAGLCVCDQFRSYYFTANDWCTRVRLAILGKLESSSGHTISESTVWTDAASPMVLVVLDELAQRTRQQLTACMYDALFGLIDKREGLPTILISNNGLDGIQRCYGDRIASRMRRGTVIDFGNIDRRQRNDAH